MAATARKQYDHRIRQATVQARDPDRFPKLVIPDSTRRSWLTRGVTEVVTLDRRDSEFVELHAHVAKLEKRVAVLTAVMRLFELRALAAAVLEHAQTSEEIPGELAEALVDAVLERAPAEVQLTLAVREGARVRSGSERVRPRCRLARRGRTP